MICELCKKDKEFMKDFLICNSCVKQLNEKAKADTHIIDEIQKICDKLQYVSNITSNNSLKDFLMARKSDIEEYMYKYENVKLAN